MGTVEHRQIAIEVLKILLRSKDELGLGRLILDQGVLMLRNCIHYN